MMDDGIEKVAGAFGDRIVSYIVTVSKDLVDIRRAAQLV